MALHGVVLWVMSLDVLFLLYNERSVSEVLADLNSMQAKLSGLKCERNRVRRRSVCADRI